MFDKKLYIKSEVYIGDDLLVQPDLAVKRCRCCGKLYFTAEFINISEAVDGKLPVCISCYRSRKNVDTVEAAIQSMAEVRICRKCKNEQHIGQFRNYDGKGNKFTDVCITCTPARPEFWKKSGDDDLDEEIIED